MRGKNRRIGEKKNLFVERTSRFVVLLVVAIVFLILYYIADSHCVNLQRSIGREESRLDALEKEWVRETERWENTKSDRNLKAALIRHGLAMRLPRVDQIVKVDRNGVPLKGQSSLARINERTSVSTVAKVSSSAAASVVSSGRSASKRVNPSKPRTVRR